MPPPRQPISADARRAVDLLAARWQAFSDLRALADIVVERGDERQRLTGVLLAKGPASVRFEALSPFGPPILIGVVHDGRLTGYNALTNEAVVGDADGRDHRADPRAAVRAARIWSPWSAGYAVPPARPAHGASCCPPTPGGRRSSLVGAVHEQRIWIDFQTGVVNQLEDHRRAGGCHA